MDNRGTDVKPGGSAPLDDLIALHTAASVEDLWRTLVVGLGLRGGQSFEAVGLFKKHHGHGGADALRTALLLCTDRRWDRDSGRLVRALVETGTLGDADIGELIECLLWSDRYRVTYPAGWVSAEWLEIDLGGRRRGGSRQRPRLGAGPRGRSPSWPHLLPSRGRLGLPGRPPELRGDLISLGRLLDTFVDSQLRAELAVACTTLARGRAASRSTCSANSGSRGRRDRGQDPRRAESGGRATYHRTPGPPR